MEKKRFTPQERIERKKSLAGERNSRVLFADVPDAHRMMDMIAALNKGIFRLRQQLGFRVTFEKGVEMLKKLKEMEKMVNDTTKEVCELVDIPYRAPRDFQESAGNSESAKDMSDGKAKKQKNLDKAPVS